MKHRSSAVGAALLSLLTVTAAVAQPASPEEDFGRNEPPTLPSLDEIRYSSHTEDRIWLHEPAVPNAPLVVELGGYGPFEQNNLSTHWLAWRFYTEGYAHAYISHRHREQVPLADVTRDLVRGIAKLLAEARRRGIDTSRIVLLGEGSAGQIAALFATRPQFFQEAQLPFEAIRGAMIVGGDFFDVPHSVATRSKYVGRRLNKLIGEDPATQRTFSPTHNLAVPNAPLFMLIAERSKLSRAEAERFAESLRSAGSEVKVVQSPSQHGQATASLIGAPGGAATPALVEFLARAATRP